MDTRCASYVANAYLLPDSSARCTTKGEDHPARPGLRRPSERRRQPGPVHALSARESINHLRRRAPVRGWPSLCANARYDTVEMSRFRRRVSRRYTLTPKHSTKLGRLATWMMTTPRELSTPSPVPYATIHEGPWSLCTIKRIRRKSCPYNDLGFSRHTSIVRVDSPKIPA